MKYLILIALAFALPLASAAHYIVGQANDADDSTSANGRTVVLWNPANGISDNVTDIVGPTGNSGADNIYFVDCEMLKTPCNIGNRIKAKIFDQGDGYSSDESNVTVTGAGYDIMPNITLTSEISFFNITVDDSYPLPLNEIDLTPASSTLVLCQGIVAGSGLDASINNVTSEFFSSSASFYGDTNDNNRHYANTSCTLNLSYGNSNQVYFNCSYSVQYYASSGNWSCFVKATKNQTISKTSSANTSMNTLLALEMPDVINYSLVNASHVSDEQIVNVTNFGNVAMNLSLEGYAIYQGDNHSMNCSAGPTRNISVNYEKYNLTASTPGTINLPTFESNYLNLTSSVVVRNFNLNSRQNDLVNDAIKSIYWRIYVPNGVSGVCSGKVIAGATSAAGI